ncbi:MAG TPA: hypothetical protein VKX17_24295 [Planctomycetota bacterium]|nr:hypothetical protein [Planctomycetota bacterium]
MEHALDLKLPPDDATPDEVLAWAEADGVDLSMLRERLRMSPTERLRRHEGALAMMLAFRNAKIKGAIHASNRETADRIGPS